MGRELPEGFGQVSVTTPGRSLIHDSLSAESLSRDRKYREWFDALNEERKDLDRMTRRSSAFGDSVGFTREGKLQLVAKLPPRVFFALVAIYGNEWLQAGGLREWLRHHPEYTVGQTSTSRMVKQATP